MASNAVLTVCDFLAGFGQSLESDLDNMQRYLSVDVAFHTGVKPFDTLAAAIDYWRDAMGGLGIECFKVRICHVGEGEDDHVFVERWDDLIDRQGRTVASLLIAAIFVVRDGRITQWRDYFNPDEMRRQLAART
jgi:limonene-1,2-epoxide hydrolase